MCHWGLLHSMLEMILDIVSLYIVCDKNIIYNARRYVHVQGKNLNHLRICFYIRYNLWIVLYTILGEFSQIAAQCGARFALIVMTYPLTLSDIVIPSLAALKVTTETDISSDFLCFIVSASMTSEPGPETSTLPRYTKSQAVI